jgi:anti-sigma factor RsiW
MTSNFDARKSSRHEAAKEMDSQQRDRFELLSAFIDGEVTAAERRQVQELLATDPQMQRLHSRLIKLRQGVQKLPVPAPESTAQETAQQVFSKIDRRRVRQTVYGEVQHSQRYLSVPYQEFSLVASHYCHK